MTEHRTCAVPWNRLCDLTPRLFPCYRLQRKFFKFCLIQTIGAKMLAARAFFLGASALISNNCRVMLNSRSPQLTQLCLLRQKPGDFQIPDKPKRPLSPYMKYVQEHRQAIKNQHPDWKVTQVVSQCAENWRDVDQTVKEKLKLEYQKQLEQYAMEVVKFQASLTEEQREELKEQRKNVKESKEKRLRKKRLRETNKPKKAPGAYSLFIMEQARAQGKPYKDLMKDMKGNWAGMNQAEKSKYLTTAAQAKAIYEEELQKWESKMVEEGNVDLVRRKTRSQLLPKRASKSSQSKQTKSTKESLESDEESQVTEVIKKRQSRKSKKITEPEQ